VEPADGKRERHEGSELMLPHVTNFADAIRGTAKPIASIEDGLHTAALCHLGNLSVDSGKKIKLDDNGDAVSLEGELVSAQRDYRGEWRAVQQRYGV
jgi:hypothetical protein